MALKGINLGGWLVAERWMTPALFEGVVADGERAIGKELSPTEAAARMKHHRDTFITEKDFKWIATHGFDFVRLPVGYWLFEDAHGYVSGKEYVDKAFRWAQKHTLGVVLDFHGLQGSQNGYDHSGEAGKIRLYRRSHKRNALRTVEYLAKTYGQEKALIGFEIINEPKTRWFIWRLLRYYDKAYAIADKYVRPEAKLIVSDSFKPMRMARALKRRRYGDRLTLDIHLYGVFDKSDQRRSYQEQVERAKREWAHLITQLQSQVPYVLVGEWSGALPAAAYGEAGEALEQVVTYIEVQRRAFSNAWAECYWSYKTPGWGAWDYRGLIDNR